MHFHRYHHSERHVSARSHERPSRCCSTHLALSTHQCPHLQVWVLRFPRRASITSLDFLLLSRHTVLKLWQRTLNYWKPYWSTSQSSPLSFAPKIPTQPLWNRSGHMNHRECTWTVWPRPQHPSKIQRSLPLYSRGTNWQRRLHDADTRWSQPRIAAKKLHKL